MVPPLPTPGRFDGVLFDLHSTLIDQGDPDTWLGLAWRHLRRDDPPDEALGAALAGRLRDCLDRIWERAQVIDPQNRRDHGPEPHRAVFDQVIAPVAAEVTARLPELAGSLADALYATLLQPWTPYDDTVPVLAALRSAGLRTAVLSNVGIDVRPVLERGGMSRLLDAVVLSYQAGAVKPDPAIFARALELIDVRPSRALMVGDSWRDDGGAAALGVRTLILPRTSGTVHGLELVLRICLPS